MKVAITGVNGFIGAQLQRYLEKNGVQTIGLCRAPRKEADYRFNLVDANEALSLPKDVNILVHCAYATKAKDLKQSYSSNIEGTLRLFDYCHMHNIRVIFISSCSAHENAQSFYGRSKYKLERKLGKNDCIVRPGFVVGNGGIYQRLEHSIAKLKFAPLFWGGQQPIQIVGIDDLLAGICALIQQEKHGTYNFVNEEPYTIQTFYEHIFKRLGLPSHFIRLPGDLALIGLKMTEFLGINLPLTSENLLGLKYLKVFESDFKKLNLFPMSLEKAQQMVGN